MTERIVNSYSAPTQEYMGMSTDTKPTDLVHTGDTFFELDSGTYYIYSEQNINPATDDGWWTW